MRRIKRYKSYLSRFIPVGAMTGLFLFTIIFNIGDDHAYIKAQSFVFSTIGVCATALVMALVNRKRGFLFNGYDFAVLLFLVYHAASRYYFLQTFLDKHLIASLSLSVFYFYSRQVNWTIDTLNFYSLGIFLIAFCLCIVGYIEHKQLTVLEIQNDYIKTTFSNSNAFGNLIACSICFPVYFLLNKQLNRIKQVLTITSISLFILIIYWSNSRTALLSILFFLSLLLLRKYRTVVGITLLIPFFIMFLAVAHSKGIDSVMGRFLIWKISILNFPNVLLGIGNNFFEVQYGLWQSNYFSSGGTLKETMLADMTYVPFNELLRILLEDGVLVFIGFLVFSYHFFINSYNLRSKKELFGILCSTFMFCLISFTSYPTYYLCNSVLLLINVSILSHYFGSSQLKLDSLFSHTISLTTLVICIIFILKINSGIKFWSNARSIDDPKSALIYYKKAAKLLPTEGLLFLAYGRAMSSFDLKTSISIYEQLTKVYTNFVAYRELGLLYERIGQLELAEKHLLIAHNMKPHILGTLETLIDFYHRQGDLSKKLFIRQKLLNTPIKVESDRALQIKKRVSELPITQ